LRKAGVAVKVGNGELVIVFVGVNVGFTSVGTAWQATSRDSSIPQAIIRTVDVLIIKTFFQDHLSKISSQTTKPLNLFIKL